MARPAAASACHLRPASMPGQPHHAARHLISQGAGDARSGRSWNRTKLSVIRSWEQTTDDAKWWTATTALVNCFGDSPYRTERLWLVPPGSGAPGPLTPAPRPHGLFLGYVDVWKLGRRLYLQADNAYDTLSIARQFRDVGLAHGAPQGPVGASQRMVASPHVPVGLVDTAQVGDPASIWAATLVMARASMPGRRKGGALARVRYDAATRERAVMMALETGKSAAQVADELGINVHTVSNWLVLDRRAQCGKDG
jgi:hypothetical protein